MPPKNDRKTDQDNKQDETSLRFACLQLAAQLYGQQMLSDMVMTVANDFHRYVVDGEVPGRGRSEEAPDDHDFNDADTNPDDEPSQPG